MSKGSIVGRADELAVLSKIVANPKERIFGGLTVVKGPAGVGKTRLMEEFTTEAAQNEVTVAWGHCSEGDGVPALWPWIQLLRKLVTQLTCPPQTSPVERLDTGYIEERQVTILPSTLSSD